MAHRINLRSERRAAFLGGLLLLLMSLPLIEAWPGEPGAAVWAVIFVLLGLHLLTRVRRLEIEPGLGTVRYRTGYLFPWLTKAYASDSIRHVRLRVKIKKRGKKRDRSFWLAFGGNHEQTVCRIRGAYFARSVGEHIAGLLNVPLIDQVTGMGEKRAARDLETPIVDIWKSRGDRVDPPVMPANSELIADETPTGFTLRFAPQPKFGRIIVAACGLFMLPIAGALAGVELLRFALSTAYLLLAVWCAAMIFMALSHTGRSTVKISTTGIKFRQGRFPISQSMQIADIEQWVPAFDGIHLIGDSGQVFIDYTGTKADRTYIHDAVRYQLQRLSEAIPQGNEVT